MNHQSSLARLICLTSLLLLCFLSSSKTSASPTSWTGTIDHTWENAGNWSQGVPNASTPAVISHSGSDNLSILLPEANLNLSSLTFGASTGNIHLAPTGSRVMALAAGSAITVESGASAISIDMGNSGQITLPGGNANSYIANYSSNLLTLTARFSRSGSGNPNIRFDGTGNILLNPTGDYTFLTASGRVYLEESFSGTLTVSGGRMNNQTLTRLDGGTFVMDGRHTSNAAEFAVNAATLSGNGRIGEQEAGSTILINFNHGSKVNPGRVGQTGALSFENNDVHFHDGSTLVFDLLDANDHDQLHFSLTGTHANNKLPVVHLAPEGVTLSLNLLEGFEATVGDEFTLLSGYDSLAGTFMGLPEGAQISAGNYLFEIHYGPNNTFLSVEAVPEPSTIAFLLLGVGSYLVYAMRHRRSGSPS